MCQCGKMKPWEMESPEINEIKGFKKENDAQLQIFLIDQFWYYSDIIQINHSDQEIDNWSIL